TRPILAAGCGSALPAPPNSKSARASPCSPTSAARSSVCPSASPMWSGARRASALAKMQRCSAGLACCLVLVSRHNNRAGNGPERETPMVAMRLLAGAVCLFASTAAFAEDPLPRAKPEDVGFSAERLARIDGILKADIEAGRIPGAVIAIARHGKLVKLDAYG